MTGGYRERIAEALDRGDRFADLHVHGGQVRTTLVAGDGSTATYETACEGAPTIVDLAPAAEWDEREAHDRDGTPFAGHEPLRPLLDTIRTSPLDGPGLRRRPVPGRRRPHPRRCDRVGALPVPRRRRPHPAPRRASVLQAPRTGARRRGPVAGGRSRVAGRACAACDVTNSVAYAQAVRGRRSDSSRRPTSPGRGRSCSSWSGSGATSTTSLPPVPASGLAAGNNASLALTERARG